MKSSAGSQIERQQASPLKRGRKEEEADMKRRIDRKEDGEHAVKATGRH
jgi:hypothetical protein